MKAKHITKFENLVISCDDYNDYITQRFHLSKQDKQNFLEIETYYGLKVDAKYGEKTYWPNHVPGDLIAEYGLDRILMGDNTLGGDLFCDNGGKGNLLAVECKSKEENSRNKNIGMGKVAPKEVALNRTQIKSNKRMLVHDFDDSSHRLQDFFSNWAIVHISAFFNEDTLPLIKNYIVNRKLPDMVPFTYRTDLIDGGYHKKQLTKVVDKMLAQERDTGRSQGLLIKPTATGKGVDPLLLFHILSERQKHSIKFKEFLNVTVNPSLKVLTGNVLKQIKHHQGLGFDCETVVMCSDLQPDDDPQDLQYLETCVTVVKNDQQLRKLIRTNKQKGRWTWIHTTMHSYHKLERALVAGCNTLIYFMSIDEVKHLVQDWNSPWCRPLHHNKITKRHLLGLDANMLKGKDAEDDSGKEYHSSMANTKVWREIYEEMKEEMAVKLGWKRKTHLFVVHFEDHKLPEALSTALYEKKNGFVRVRGTNMVVPYMWILQAQTIFIGRWKNPSRRHTMVTNNSIDNSKKFCSLLRILWPKMLATIPNTKANRSIKRRLAKTHIVSIYDLGKNGRQISKQLGHIPIKHKDSIIGQVKLLTEGWDPKNAWLDSWAFADPAHSKIRIYQVGGRPARIGNDIFNPSMRDSMCFVPYIIQSDLTKELAINAANRTLANTAEAMQIGKDTIEDVTTFFDANQFSVPSVRTKGSKNKKEMIVVGMNKLMDSFVNYYQSGRRWSPWSETVSKIFQECMAFYSFKNNNLRHVGFFYKSIYQKKEYKDFFTQFKKKPEDILGRIRSGDYWLLTDEEKDIAKIKLAEYQDFTLPNMCKKRWESYAEAARTMLEKPISPDQLTSQGHGCFIPELLKLLPNEYKGRIYGFFRSNYAGGSKIAPEEYKRIKSMCVEYERQFNEKLAAKISIVKKDYEKALNNCVDPTSPKRFGELNKRMQIKYGLKTSGHSARFVKYQGLRPLQKKSAVKNQKIIRNLYLSHVHTVKSVSKLDIFVANELKKIGLTEVDMLYLRQIRKKSSKIRTALLKFPNRNQYKILLDKNNYSKAARKSRNPK